MSIKQGKSAMKKNEFEFEMGGKISRRSFMY